MSRKPAPLVAEESVTLTATPVRYIVVSASTSAPMPACALLSQTPTDSWPGRSSIRPKTSERASYIKKLRVSVIAIAHQHPNRPNPGQPIFNGLFEIELRLGLSSGHQLLYAIGTADLFSRLINSRTLPKQHEPCGFRKSQAHCPALMPVLMSSTMAARASGEAARTSPTVCRKQ